MTMLAGLYRTSDARTLSVLHSEIGCRRRAWLVGLSCLLFTALPLNAASATAQAQTATTSGYVTEAPNNPLWLALATPDGRWAIQLAGDCTAIVAEMNVTVEGRIDVDEDVQLVSAIGERCSLVESVRMSDVACARNTAGECDVQDAQ